MTKEAMTLALEALELMYACYAHPDWISHKQQEEKILAQCVATTMTLRQALAKQEQGEPVAWMGDNEIFDKLNHIYGDPKHHKYPLTKGQIVEFGRKLFELGANSSSPKVEQDPVAWTEQQLYDDGTPNPCALLKWAGRKAEDDFPIGTKFYTTPPQRKRLSGFGKAAIGRKHFGNPIPQEWYAAADDLEAAHGIKE